MRQEKRNIKNKTAAAEVTAAAVATADAIAEATEEYKTIQIEEKAQALESQLPKSDIKQ